MHGFSRPFRHDYYTTTIHQKHDACAGQCETYQRTNLQVSSTPQRAPFEFTTSSRFHIQRACEVKSITHLRSRMAADAGGVRRLNAPVTPQPTMRMECETPKNNCMTTWPTCAQDMLTHSKFVVTPAFAHAPHRRTESERS